MQFFESLGLHWWVWIGISLISAAPHLYRFKWKKAFRGIARCITWWACPLFLSLIVVQAIFIVMGPVAEIPFSLLDVFDFKSPFTGYGLAATIGTLFGALGSYIPKLDFLFSAGHPSDSARADAAAMDTIAREKNSGRFE